MDIEQNFSEGTLCYLLGPEGVLLAKKKKKIGIGLWNGYGGGMESGEDARQAAVRELQEESGGVVVSPPDLKKSAEIDFHNATASGGTSVCRIHVFLARQWHGHPRETEEMGAPRWFGLEALPVWELMPADPEWLPLVLAGRIFRAKAIYGPGQKNLLAPVEIREIADFED